MPVWCGFFAFRADVTITKRTQTGTVAQLPNEPNWVKGANSLRSPGLQGRDGSPPSILATARITKRTQLGHRPRPNGRCAEYGRLGGYAALADKFSPVKSQRWGHKKSAVPFAEQITKRSQIGA